jgi:hypothetical protein
VALSMCAAIACSWHQKSPPASDDALKLLAHKNMGHTPGNRSQQIKQNAKGSTKNSGAAVTN